MDYLHSALQILNSVFCLQVNESIIPTTSLSALPWQLGLCCYWPQALENFSFRQKNLLNN